MGVSLTITDKTTMHDIQDFADKVKDGDQLRAKTDKHGNTVWYTKSGSSWFGTGKKRAEKSELLMTSLQKQIDKHTGKGSESASPLKSIVKSHDLAKGQVFLKGSDLQSILTKTEKMEKVETMSSSTAVVSTSDRPQMMVAMGQGAIGRLDEIQLYSDSFSSCNPVILYNSETGMGGLFHVPSPGIEGWRDGDDYRTVAPFDDVSMSYRGGVREALAEMIELIKPTSIFVRPGGHGLSESREGHDSMRSGMLGVIDTASYVAEDMKSIVGDLGLETEVVFQPEESSGVVSVTGDGHGGIDIHKSDITSRREVNLLRRDLPEDLSDKTMVWSHIESTDDSVLVGSKF